MIVIAVQGHMERQADRQTGRQADRQTGRQTDRQIGRQADRQTDRQADRQTGRELRDGGTCKFLLVGHARPTDGVDGVEERVRSFQRENFEGGNGDGARLSGDTASESGDCPRSDMVFCTH